ncbi:MAG: SDR family oxidoreductase [Chloroflexi bacterium]|nr:SDR family oxidoreductase [Chloroflexota bacterium]
MTFEGRVAIVTGGARGIGEGIASALAAGGAKIAIFDLDGEAAEATAAALGVEAIGLAVDCIEETDVAAATEKVVARFGAIDILANNAGAGRGPIDLSQFQGQEGLLRGGALSDNQAQWDLTLAQNLRTTFLASKAAVPHIAARGGGSIVNIASIAGQVASPTLAAYAAAKAGVISLTRSMALELGPKGIRVNAICPGFLWTRAWEGLATSIQMSNPAMKDLTPREVFLNVVKQGVPLGREQTPADIGNLAAFLSSDLGMNITGQAIAVDGGITLR